MNYSCNDFAHLIPFTNQISFSPDDKQCRFVTSRGYSYGVFCCLLEHGHDGPCKSGDGQVFSPMNIADNQFIFQAPIVY